jgi:predicted nuclease of predicted toxin-antitoxin system
VKIVADESIESEIVAALRRAGHTVSDIKETTPGIEDQQVLSLANETDAILLTNDKISAN